MASKEGLFKKLDLNIHNLKIIDKQKNNKYIKEIRVGKNEIAINLYKEENSDILDISISNKADKELIDFVIKTELSNIIINFLIPNTYIISAERTGATIFRNDLNLASKNVVDILNKSQKDGKVNLESVLKTLFSERHEIRTYPKPILKNVDFISAFSDDSNEVGYLIKNYPYLIDKFENIVGGKYSTKNGVTDFIPINTKTRLNLNVSSSSVRSLAIFYYWLKYKANEGDMLIIDEPELNLHPANQRKLARFLVALVNHNVKVFLTTHSDYLIREFNTLIMLNQDKPHIQNVLEKFKEQGYDETDKLDYKKVLAYVVAPKNAKSKSITLNKVDINEYGMEIKSFDDTLDEIIAIQGELYNE